MNTNDIERRENHCEKILRLLRNAAPGWVPCGLLASFSRNHTARVSDLRRKGVDIECRVIDEETGATEYRLVREGDPKDRQVTCHVQVIGIDPDDPNSTEPAVQDEFTCTGERFGTTVVCKIPRTVTFYEGDTMEVTWKFSEVKDG